MYIPENIRQTPRSYALGEYIIHPDYKNNKPLEQWIETISFEQAEIDSNRMQMHSRKRNNLFTFKQPDIDKEVVLKVSQNSKHYRWYRKLNLSLISLFKDYSLNAYYGGITLEKLGILTPKVIAHWSCKRQGERKKSYLMYEKVDANMTVFALCEKLNLHHSNATEVIQEITKILADVVKQLHENNFRHGDPHSGNFLLSNNIQNVANMTTSSCKNLKLYLIDLDKACFVKNEKPWKKKLLDIRCMRRFRVPGIESNTCLKHYYGRPPSILEKLILKFWMKGGMNPYKWIKRSEKRI
ncbi:MAG: lipopolysaccharide kinase InaA family protein [Pseudomonadota bacterium]